MKNENENENEQSRPHHNLAKTWPDIWQDSRQWVTQFFFKFPYKSGQVSGEELAGYTAGFREQFSCQIFVSFLVQIPHSSEAQSSTSKLCVNLENVHSQANIPHRHKESLLYTHIGNFTNQKGTLDQDTIRVFPTTEELYKRMPILAQLFLQNIIVPSTIPCKENKGNRVSFRPMRYQYTKCMWITKVQLYSIQI